MGQKKRMNPHDLAQIGMEKCNLNVFRIGEEKSNDLSTMLCHFIWGCRWSWD